MFSGIVEGRTPLATLERLEGLIRLGVKLPSAVKETLKRGDSVSINGVCLTVAEFADEAVCFDVMLETLNKTTLGALTIGAEVNYERSLAFGQTIGGHILSGHIDETAEIVSVETPPNNHIITFKLSPRVMRYVFSKGYIALNGASLTVCDADKVTNTFRVFLIPETLRLTTFGSLKKGDRVNVEVERQTQVIVDTVNELLPSLLKQS